MLQASSSESRWYHELLNVNVQVTVYLTAVCLGYWDSMYPSVWCSGA